LFGLAILKDPSFEDTVLSIVRKRQNDDNRIGTPWDGWAIDKDGDSLLDSWKKSEIAREVESLIPILENLETSGWRREGKERPCATMPLAMEQSPHQTTDFDTTMPDLYQIGDSEESALPTATHLDMSAVTLTSSAELDGLAPGNLNCTTSSEPQSQPFDELLVATGMFQQQQKPSLGQIKPAQCPCSSSLLPNRLPDRTGNSLTPTFASLTAGSLL
jgi:hypothetical protein